MDKAIPILAVVGPTASGKTALAVDIALRYGGEVVSADSMQVYRGMDIATAKPSMEERKGVPHHLMGVIDPSVPFSVAEYAQMAHETIRDIHDRGRLPILAGGTGLYVDAVLRDLAFAEMKSDPALREELFSLGREQGPAALWELLRECDPESAASLHENNMGRVVRAIEVYRLTGVPMSEQQRRSRAGRSRYLPLKLGLNFRDRQVLYSRINARVDKMLEEGLLEEAREFLRRSSGPTAAQAIGYKELLGYFSGALSLDQAAENLKRESRRYAKRQLTWFRRDEEILWFYPDETNLCQMEKNICDSIDNFLKVCYDKDNSPCPCSIQRGNERLPL